MSFQLHPQLLADCHVLLQWPICHVLLHRNAIVPWLILVPETDHVDLLEMPAGQREAVLNEAACIAKVIQQHWKLEKINFAQLGNVVPQMHLHVIGRTSTDPCWPRPIWGNLPEQARDYSVAEVQEIRVICSQVSP